LKENNLTVTAPERLFSRSLVHVLRDRMVIMHKCRSTRSLK